MCQIAKFVRLDDHHIKCVKLFRLRSRKNTLPMNINIAKPIHKRFFLSYRALLQDNVYVFSVFNALFSKYIICARVRNMPAKTK